MFSCKDIQIIRRKQLVIRITVDSWRRKRTSRPDQQTILEAIRHTKYCRASGTLIVPHWPSALGVYSMNIRVEEGWGGIMITFIPCFKAKVRPINIPTREQL